MHRNEEVRTEKEAEVERLEVIRIRRLSVEADPDDDQEQVARKLLELWSAVRRKGIFDREWVESLDAFEHLDLRRVTNVDVDPCVSAAVGDRSIDLVDGKPALRLTSAIDGVAP